MKIKKNIYLAVIDIPVKVYYHTIMVGDRGSSFLCLKSALRGGYLILILDELIRFITLE